MTPLGEPVVPAVNMTMVKSSSSPIGYMSSPDDVDSNCSYDSHPSADASSITTNPSTLVKFSLMSSTMET